MEILKNCRNERRRLAGAGQNNDYTTVANSRQPTRPHTEMMVSSTDQDLMVSMMLRLKYSLNSQKPGSLTCEKITLPEPTAITISSGLTPVVAIRGGHDAAGGDCRHGGGTQRQTQRGGD